MEEENYVFIIPSEHYIHEFSVDINKAILLQLDKYFNLGYHRFSL